METQTQEMTTPQPLSETLPSAKQAEKALLTNLFKYGHRPDLVEEVTRLVSPPDFTDRWYREVYSAILELFDENVPPDPVDVVQKLGTDKTERVMAIASGDIYEHIMVGEYSIIRNAEIIREASERRRLIMAGRKIVDIGMHGEFGSARELFDQAESTLAKVEPVEIVKTGLVPLLSLIPSYMDQLAEMNQQANDPTQELKTGIMTRKADLDAMLTGLKKTEMSIIGARPSVGKTAFLLDLMLECSADEKTHAAMFSAEMSKNKPLIDRVISNRGRIDSGILRTAMLEQEDWSRVNNGISQISPRFYIDDTPSMTITHIKREARKLRREIGPDADLLIGVDYLQLINAPGQSRYDQVSLISRELKSLARELNAHVCALAQLSRSVEQRNDKRPLKSDLKESGQIEQDADVIMFLHRDDYYNPETDRKNIVEIIISKQRNGPTGTAELVFMKQFGAFLSLQRA